MGALQDFQRLGAPLSTTPNPAAPQALASQPIANPLSNNGIGNRPAFANQPIIIQNALQLPDGVLHQLNDTNAVFTADGRTLQ